MTRYAANGIHIPLVRLEHSPKDVDRNHLAVLSEHIRMMLLVVWQRSALSELMDEQSLEYRHEQIVQAMLVTLLVHCEQLSDDLLLHVEGDKFLLQDLYDVARMQLEESESRLDIALCRDELHFHALVPQLLSKRCIHFEWNVLNTSREGSLCFIQMAFVGVMVL